MATLYIMCGLPGAGKSTFTTSRPDLETVCMDRIRFELFGDEAVQTNGRRVFEIAMARVKNALEAGRDCVFDGTNTTRRRRRALMQRFSGVRFVCVWVATPLDLCIQRNAARTRVVPVEVIKRYAQNFMTPDLSEGFAEILKITY